METLVHLMEREIRRFQAEEAMCGWFDHTCGATIVDGELSFVEPLKGEALHLFNRSTSEEMDRRLAEAQRLTDLAIAEALGSGESDFEDGFSEAHWRAIDPAAWRD